MHLTCLIIVLIFMSCFPLSASLSRTRDYIPKSSKVKKSRRIKGVPGTYILFYRNHLFTYDDDNSIRFIVFVFNHISILMFISVLCLIIVSEYKVSDADFQ
jgi:hypothetical protein